jgi:probable HAF family extracellular repeat protein
MPTANRKAVHHNEKEKHMLSRKLSKAMFAATTTALTMQAAAYSVTAQVYNPSHLHHRYQVVDVGTLGGPQSKTFGLIGSLNGIGGFATDADTSMQFPAQDVNLYFSGVYDGYASHGAQWRRQGLRDLGTLRGGSNSGIGSINDLGQVAGASDNGTVDPLAGVWEVHAVLWTDNAIHDLGTLGGYESIAFSVNNWSQVTGGALNTVPDSYTSFFGISGATQIHTFLWKNGRMNDLGTLGGPDSVAYNINNAGQIAGESFTGSAVNLTTGLPTLDVFLWEGNHMRDLGTLGGVLSFESWLNRFGQVVGSSDLAGDQVFHPFLWSHGRLQDLGTLGGNYGSANWVNDAGEVVGYATLPGDQSNDPFLWKNGTMIDLGLPPGATCASATAINSQQQIVGISGICGGPDGGGFLWENGGPIVDLNSVISPGSGLQIIAAQNISDDGEIACNATLPNGDVHAVLLIPCDNNHPGVCDDYSEIDTSNSPVLLSRPGAAEQVGGESIVRRLWQLRSGRHAAALHVSVIRSN